MSKITNKPNFDAFRKHMKDAAKELGIDLEMGSISYGNEEFSFSAKCYNGEAGKREEFIRVSHMKGNFPGSWFGGEFEKGGNKYKITGAFSRGRKYTIQLTNMVTGETSKCAPNYVRTGNPISENMKAKGIVQKGGVLV